MYNYYADQYGNLHKFSNPTRKATMPNHNIHRKASVQAALKAVRQSQNSDVLVDAIKEFDHYRNTLSDKNVLVWEHRFGKESGQRYKWAAVYISATGLFHCTDGGVRDWDEMLTEWVTYEVRPDEVMIVSNSYPLQAF